MREKILWLVIIISAFLLGGGATYYITSHDKTTKVIMNSNSGTSVIQCSEDITIDESGIALSVGKIYNATVTIQNYSGNSVSSMGSGFVYKKDEKYGYIMTNQHVIEHATKILVTMADDSIVEAELLGSDQYLDLAVLRIDVNSVIQVATIGNSEKSSIGDTIFTVGSPVSYEYRGTVTKGTLSGKNRMVSVSISSTDDWVMKVLQVDAAINPGNSGGPLVNVNGEVIGINSLKLVEDEVEGMGFAIPIEYAFEYVGELESGRKIERPFIGISMLNLNDTYALYKNGIIVNNSIKEGVVVVSVTKNSGAAKAGIQKGDVITKIGATTVKNAAYLKYELYKYDPNDTIEVTYIRNGTEQKTQLTLTKAE